MTKRKTTKKSDSIKPPISAAARDAMEQVAALEREKAMSAAHEQDRRDDVPAKLPTAEESMAALERDREREKLSARSAAHLPSEVNLDSAAQFGVHAEGPFQPAPDVKVTCTLRPRNRTVDVRSADEVETLVDAVQGEVRVTIKF